MNKRRAGDYRIILLPSFLGRQTRHRPQRLHRLLFVIPYWADITLIKLKTHNEALEAIHNDKRKRVGWNIIDA